MMMKRALTLVAGAALALTLAACGSSSTTATSSTSAAAGGSSAAMTSEAMTSEAMTSEAMTSGAMTSGAMTSGAMASGAMADRPAPATLVGAGCADYAAAVPTGAGSVEGMALDPVATAASNNPLLTTLTAAVSGKVNPGVDLVTTLNNGEFTVFAPVDTAFAKIDAATMTTLTTDAPCSPGSSPTTWCPASCRRPRSSAPTRPPKARTLEVTGSGDNLKVNGANVICGGVKTKNATVYLIDTVLTPPAA